MLEKLQPINFPLFVSTGLVYFLFDHMSINKAADFFLSGFLSLLGFLMLRLLLLLMLALFLLFFFFAFRFASLFSIVLLVVNRRVGGGTVITRVFGLVSPSLLQFVLLTAGRRAHG